MRPMPPPTMSKMPPCGCRMRRDEDEAVLREKSHMADLSQKWKVGLQERHVSEGVVR
jgi:hypothetical protein